MSTRRIKVPALARVEGEGGMAIRLRDGQVAEVKLNIFEPPRFFEGLLRGRDFREAPDITARICGICPIAYQISALGAMEAACGVTVGGQLRELRRLIYCGEWIGSHVLHIFFLHAPDYLGYPDVIRMAHDHPALVERALRMKQAGNAIVRLLGGREVHPINLRVGGFYKLPTRAELGGLVEPLRAGRELAADAVARLAELPRPRFERDYELVALRHPSEYPFMADRLASSQGVDIGPEGFEETFEERQVAHSTALHARVRGRGAYLVGPLARYSLNFDRLSPSARQAARAAGLGPTCRNPFDSIVVRAVEVLHAFDEALGIIERYQPPDQPALPVTPRAGVGYGWSEAPRGVLYHRYEIAADGSILSARIVPPTAQNQASVEGDLAAYAQDRADLPDDELTYQCEQLVRSYDPCISCSTHLLRLDLRRE